MSIKPDIKPVNPSFSSGPCAKRPKWNPDFLKDAFLGRSHRAGQGKKLLKQVIEDHRRILKIPDDYKIGIVPASDTGAIEMAMWSMLGARGIEALAWESFGTGWQKDIIDHLKIEDVDLFCANYGDIADLSKVNSDRDIIFTWNGTTSGVCVPNGEWIKSNRKGLTFCDATSAVFAYDLPWDKLDVTTWSWQKVIGGEAAHGMLVLSPRAIERLESYKPDRPLPKIFRMVKNGKFDESIFEGLTINTPSMMCVADILDSLKWVESIGGLYATIKRCRENLSVIEDWVEKTDWVDFLARSEDIRSRTSVCLKITDSWFEKLGDKQMDFVQALCKLLENENAAYDIKSYRDAPAGLRIWTGATIEKSDLEILTKWLDWGYEKAKKNFS